MPDRQEIVTAEGNAQPQSLADQTSEIAWETNEELNYEQWSAIAYTLQTVGKALPFWIGDVLVYGEQRFGEMYTQVIEETEYSRETCKKFKAVASRIPKARRRAGCSWSAHFAVCYLEPAVADRLLRVAEEFGLSVRDIKLIAALPDKQPFLSFLDNALQLRYAEVMTEARRLLEAASETDDDIPFNDPVEQNAENGALAWLGEEDGDPFAAIRDFFANSGVPIVYSDDTTVVWEGGIRLYVSHSDTQAYITWERTA